MNRFLAPAAATIAALGLLAGACSDRILTPPASAPVSTESAAQTVPSQPGTSQQSPTGATAATTVSKPNELSTTDLVKLVEPSIVRIDTTAGIGTGFFVSDDGYIVTNAHVVTGRNGAPQTTVGVTLSDGSRIDGTVVGVETARFDVAIVKVSGPARFKALPFANLANVLVGQDVVAIGYALDLKGGEGPSFTVTRGIVSAKNRSTTEDPRAQSFGAIQTDAAITHGNSGGPLLNLNGEVVGVNTSIAPDPSTGGVAAGIGFALGSDVVKAVYDDVRVGGKVTRGYLGIGSFEALRPARARELNLPEDATGVYLAGPGSVVAGSPADLAGIKSGDVISKIDGMAIHTETDLGVAMLREEPNKKVDIEIYHGGKKLTVTVTLGTLPGQ